jgi:hypothetical protein
MKLRQAPIPASQPRQPLQHCLAIHFKLAVRKGVAGQCRHSEGARSILRYAQRGVEGALCTN